VRGRHRIGYLLFPRRLFSNRLCRPLLCSPLVHLYQPGKLFLVIRGICLHRKKCNTTNGKRIDTSVIQALQWNAADHRLPSLGTWQGASLLELASLWHYLYRVTDVTGTVTDLIDKRLYKHVCSESSQSILPNFPIFISAKSIPISCAKMNSIV
jgi:hypothetical protein